MERKFSGENKSDKPRTPKPDISKADKPAALKTDRPTAEKTERPGTSKPDSLQVDRPAGLKTDRPGIERTDKPRFIKKPGFRKAPTSETGPGSGAPKKFRPKVLKGPKQTSNVPPKVKELMKKHNLSARAAFRVYKGVWTVEQAIQDDVNRENRKKQAEEICKKYPDMNMSLACCLLKDGITPEQFFAQKQERRKKRIEKQLSQKKRLCVDPSQRSSYESLTKFCDQKIALELARYGERFQEGYIKDFGPYEMLFVSEGVEFDIHRLKIKYMYEKRFSELVKKWVVLDKSIQKKKLRPAYRPINRYQFPEGVLQVGAEIMLALHEGEMIRGKILWFTPYDIMLQSNKAEIWVFRHSIVECALIRKPQ